MYKIGIFYLSNEGTERDNRMQDRFSKIDIRAERVPWVSKEWLIEKKYDSYEASGCQFGHLKMLKRFIETGYEYGCFLEDDVYLKKTFNKDIVNLINKMEELKLDLLLIGYLINYKPYEESNWHKVLDSSMILRYYDRLWGSQGYLITKNHATHLINKYNEDYLDRILKGENLTPFLADWTLTKDGNRALVWPMLAVEEGIVSKTEQDQIDFHKSCKDFSYNPQEYI